MNYSTNSDHMPKSPKSTTRRWLQPVLVITISLLLHLILFDWLSARHRNSISVAPAEEVIVASLLAPVAPVLPTPTPVEPAPVKSVLAPAIARRTQVKAAAVQRAEIQPVDDALPSAPPPQEYATAVPEVAMESPKMTAAEVAPPPAVSTSAPTSAPTSATTSTSTPTPVSALHFAPPPSAEVKYDVQALRDGKTVYGSGKIIWKSTGGTYEIDGEAGVLFFSVLTFKSEGSLDEQGITPLRYSEKRFRKSETNTHFQREPKRISFSASTLQYPRTGGEQDRASIIWQLVALGRADPAQFGDGLDIFVAGVRDGDTWHVQVLGQEQITVGGASINAWHLLRTPRAGSFDTQVDIWLAPTRDWYPVKLRQTERNGDYLDMSMSSITTLSP